MDEFDFFSSPPPTTTTPPPPPQGNELATLDNTDAALNTGNEDSSWILENVTSNILNESFVFTSVFRIRRVQHPLKRISSVKTI